MTEDLLIRLTARLIKDARHTVFLILNNLRSHHSKIVTNRLEEHKVQIKVFDHPS